MEKNLIVKASNGPHLKIMNIKLTGFDKDGKEKELEFTAQKIFVKMHSYAYTIQIKRCNSLGRSKKDELPAKVKEKIGAK